MSRTRSTAYLWLWVLASAILLEASAAGFAQGVRRASVWVLHNGDPDSQTPPFEDTLAL